MKNEIVLNHSEETDYSYNEAMKTLRTNIQFSGTNMRVIMFTSSVPNEGKSEISFNLASSSAQLGNKVLLIDADIRKSVLVSRYQMNRRVDGLSQYLSGQRTKEETIYKTNIKGLDLMLAGPFCPNPAELLEEKLFRELIAWARERYDSVIIDTPPMGNLIDGAIIGRSCDGAVIVIESGGISYRVLQKVRRQLEMSGCRILGTVLNKVDIRQGNYYYYGKYYGHEEGK